MKLHAQIATGLLLILSFVGSAHAAPADPPIHKIPPLELYPYEPGPEGAPYTERDGYSPYRTAVDRTVIVNALEGRISTDYRLGPCAVYGPETEARRWVVALNAGPGRLSDDVRPLIQIWDPTADHGPVVVQQLRVGDDDYWPIHILEVGAFQDAIGPVIYAIWMDNCCWGPIEAYAVSIFRPESSGFEPVTFDPKIDSFNGGHIFLVPGLQRFGPAFVVHLMGDFHEIDWLDSFRPGVLKTGWDLDRLLVLELEGDRYKPTGIMKLRELLPGQEYTEKLNAAESMKAVNKMVVAQLAESQWRELLQPVDLEHLNDHQWVDTGG